MPIDDKRNTTNTNRRKSVSSTPLSPNIKLPDTIQKDT